MIFRRKLYKRLLEWKKWREGYIIYTKDLRVENGYTYIPIYMAGLI